MDLSGLTGIGRLGGKDERGFFQVLVRPRHRQTLLDAEDVYLIFDSDRVFFVTISEKEISDRKISVRFAEDGIAEERKLHRETIIAIEAEADDQEDPETLLGYSVLFQDQELGRVVDYFHNNAQYVLVIETLAGAELLVPWVDHYVSAVLPDPGMVVLQNAEPLLDQE